jgi:hypothetical protein
MRSLQEIHRVETLVAAGLNDCGLRARPGYIALAPWQKELVLRHPELLLRGLIHSDGCRSINTIRHPKKTYEYPRYQFSNRSDDIKRIFSDACDLLGIEWRVMNRWDISVARRASVARLDEFIGPKA